MCVSMRTDPNIILAVYVDDLVIAGTTQEGILKF